MRAIASRIRSLEAWFLAVVAAYAVACAVFVVRCVHVVNGRLRVSLFDDAMISMRYAHHLASGHGLVWNVGDAPIEGFSNPLWTLWMAVLHLLPVSLDLVPLLVMASSAVLLVANLFVVRAVARRVAPRSRIACVAAVVLVASYYPLLYWSLRGMEVGLVAFLVDVAVLLALRVTAAGDRPAARDERWLVVVLVALVLTRTDAAVPAVVVAAWLTLAAPPARRRRDALVFGGAIVATGAALTVFRLAYFGDPLPNTYYLKLTGVPLSTRVHVGASDLARLVLVHLVAAVVLAALALWRTRLRAGTTLLAAVVVGQFAYSVSVGGDAWEGLSYANRYLCVALPALLVLAGAGIDRVVRGAATSTARRIGLLAALGAVTVVAVRLWGDQPDTLTPGIADVASWNRRLIVIGAAFVAVAVLHRPIGRWVHDHRAVGAGVLLAVAVLAVDGPAVATWWRHNAALLDGDRAMLDRGHLFADATAPDVTIAAYWAGNSPWADDRRTYDILGKSDAKIAHERPFTDDFRPGHDKKDLDYTVGQLRPDIVDLGFFFGMSDAEARQYDAWGYELFPGGIEVRRDSTRVDRAQLRVTP